MNYTVSQRKIMDKLYDKITTYNNRDILAQHRGDLKAHDFIKMKLNMLEKRKKELKLKWMSPRRRVSVLRSSS